MGHHYDGELLDLAGSRRNVMAGFCFLFVNICNSESFTRVRIQKVNKGQMHSGLW